MSIAMSTRLHINLYIKNYKFANFGAFITKCTFIYLSRQTITIAGDRDVPVEITGGLWIDRHDIRYTQSHDEVDILIAQHASISLSFLGKYVRIVCDDTDVFVLLVHYNNSRFKGSNSAQ